MKISHVLAFIGGVAVGYFSAVYFLNEKYEKRYNEDVKSTIEAFSLKSKDKDIKDNEEHKDVNITKISDEEIINKVKDYAKVIKNMDYSSKYTVVDENEEEKEEEVLEPIIEHDDVQTEPFLISESEFGLYDDYGIVQWNYFSDGVLTDEYDEVVTDITNTIGELANKEIRETVENAIYVRNDRLKLDYEILKNEGTYSELLDEKPYLK